MSNTLSDAAEDSEDSSSSLQSKNVLDKFLEKWQHEIHVENLKCESGKNTINNREEETDGLDVDYISKENEDKAKSLFLQGAEMEKLGKVFDAMRLYRLAIQIVPDIEFKLYEATKSLSKQMHIEQEIDENEIDRDNNKHIKDHGNDEDLNGVDLMERFQLAIQKTGRLFQRSSSEKNVITTGLHISDLPMEIILYILRWVVSNDLDLRSLDQCSSVSKGFYICAKDHDIWKLACLKIWGVNVGCLKASPYISWRQMFLERHRVHFSGCYISKTSYLRYGENSFQDQFYRPVQLIEYYRYIRFFPDGNILMMTTSDDPAQSVNKLKSKHQMRHDILKGHYRLHGDMVIIVLKRNRTPQLYHRPQRRGSIIEEVENHTLYLELKIVSSTKRRFNQLQWKHYSIIQIKNKTEVSSDFELTQKQYPPLIFSRVKSYHLVSENPLQ